MNEDKTLRNNAYVTISTHSFPIINSNYFPKIWRQTKLPEVYTGQMVQNCLHDVGTYKWYKDDEEYQYEGKFYANNLHGYGKLTYPDNSFYEGLFFQNRRFGPGVFTYHDGTQDVGIWEGTNIVRLNQSITFNESVPVLAKSIVGKAYILNFKNLIDVEYPYEDYATELLKEMNAPEEVIKNSQVLYSNSVRNPNSTFFNQKLFYETFSSNENDYIIKIIDYPTTLKMKDVKYVKVTKLLAWNNDSLPISIMRHAFMNRKHENLMSFQVSDVMTGQRYMFKEPGWQERQCLHFLYACCSDNDFILQRLIYDNDLYPNLTDCHGNNGIIYAAVNNKISVIQTLTNFGANLDNLNDECLSALQLSILRYISIKYDIPIIYWEAAFLPPCSQFQKFPPEIQEWPPPADTLHNSIKHRSTITRSNAWLTKLQGNFTGQGKKLPNYVFDLSCVIPKDSNTKSSLKLSKQIDKNYKFTKESSMKISFKSETLLPEISESDDSNKFKCMLLIKIIETIYVLLQCGASANLGEIPFCPLMTSLFTRCPEMIQYLIKFGADIEIKTPNETGSLAPLHVIVSLAPCNELAEMAKIFLQNGANPNELCSTNHWVEQKSELLVDYDIQDFGKTPLHILCMRFDFINDTENYLCNLLLTFISFNADLNYLYLGHTPLSLTILRGNIKLIECLLNSGKVDPNGVLGNGMGVPLTVLTLKRYKNYLPLDICKQVYRTLLKYYANPLNIIPNFQVNALDFARKDNTIQIPSKKRKPAREKIVKTPVIKILKRCVRKTLIQNIQGRAVKIIYNYKIECGFNASIFDILTKFVDFKRAFKIIQILIDTNSIYPVRRYCVAFFKYISSYVNMPKRFYKKYINFDNEIERQVDKLNFNKKVARQKQLSFKTYLPEVDPDYEKYIVCFECLQKIGKNLLLCPSCLLLYFCSQECYDANNARKNTKHPCKNYVYDIEKFKSDVNAKKQEKNKGFQEQNSILKQYEVMRNSLMQDPVYLKTLQKMNILDHELRKQLLEIIRKKKKRTVINKETKTNKKNLLSEKRIESSQQDNIAHESSSNKREKTKNKHKNESDIPKENPNNKSDKAKIKLSIKSDKAKKSIINQSDEAKESLRNITKRSLGNKNDKVKTNLGNKNDKVKTNLRNKNEKVKSNLRNKDDTAKRDLSNRSNEAKETFRNKNYEVIEGLRNKNDKTKERFDYKNDKAERSLNNKRDKVRKSLSNKKEEAKKKLINKSDEKKVNNENIKSSKKYIFKNNDMQQVEDILIKKTVGPLFESNKHIRKSQQSKVAIKKKPTEFIGVSETKKDNERRKIIEGSKIQHKKHINQLIFEQKYLEKNKKKGTSESISSRPIYEVKTSLFDKYRLSEDYNDTIQYASYHMAEIQKKKDRSKEDETVNLFDPEMSKLMSNLKVKKSKYLKLRQERLGDGIINDEYRLILSETCEEFDYKFWQMFMPFCVYIEGQLYYKFQNEEDVFYKLNYSHI